MKESTRYVYTLSSKDDMVQQTLISIKSLLRYVDEDQVTVFLTPPADNEDKKLLKELVGDVRTVENISDPIKKSIGSETGRYGEKLNLCNLECENVVFLDCDTVVLSDITKVLKGDFDFKARPGGISYSEKKWAGAFERANEEHLDWIPNAGFMIFKNQTHKKIQEKWTEYFRKGPEITGLKNPFTEQHALALAISSHNLEKMDQKEHVMLWNNEKSESGFVYHYGNKWNSGKSESLPRRIYRKIIELNSNL